MDSGTQNVRCEDVALDIRLVESNSCGGGGTDTIGVNVALTGQLASCGVPGPMRPLGMHAERRSNRGVAHRVDFALARGTFESDDCIASGCCQMS